jgi:hypothetical protein
VTPPSVHEHEALPHIQEFLDPGNIFPDLCTTVVAGPGAGRAGRGAVGCFGRVLGCVGDGAGEDEDF